MPRIFTTNISETECMGDSLTKINNNDEILDTAVQQLSGGSIRQANNNFTATANLSVIGTTTLNSTTTIRSNLFVQNSIFQYPIVTATGIFTSDTQGGDTIFIFTGNGTISVSNALGLNARVLLVGGGGGGGARYYSGGGGGGQVLETRTVLPSGTIEVVVGAGGVGGNDEYVRGKNGSITRLGNIVALGGGGGGSYSGEPWYHGHIGASSGGCSGYTGLREYHRIPALAGFSGGIGAGYGAGGGGGAGGLGANGTSGRGGSGGDGLASDITGDILFYGPGGGGGGYSNSSPAASNGGAGGSLEIGGRGGAFNIAPLPGTPNRGAGGGGANNTVIGGNGSAGVVIVRFRL